MIKTSESVLSEDKSNNLDLINQVSDYDIILVILILIHSIVPQNFLILISLNLIDTEPFLNPLLRF